MPCTNLLIPKEDVMRLRLPSLIVVFGLCVIGLNGCGTGQPGGAEGEAGHAEEHADEEHAHSDVGPHDGHIIELGTEDYHVELTHDEATHKTGVYILGSDAKTAKPIDSASVTINVLADGQTSQYHLPAVPQAGEEAGRVSYFELVDAALCTVVCGESEAKNTQARLSLNIGGKPFVGMIETDPHEHEHGHEH
jgi:hypothetical protein